MSPQLGLVVKTTTNKKKLELLKRVTNPLPMQYLGAKGRIADWIISCVSKDLPNTNVFVDLFAGTGTVSLFAASYNYKIIANDLQPYSSNILDALFQYPRNNVNRIIKKVSLLSAEQLLLTNGRKYASKMLTIEKKFFSSSKTKSFDWKSYKKFCDNTPLISGIGKDVLKLRESNQYNLFIKYYSNTYFGIRQCLEIDAIKELSDSLPKKDRVILSAATISALTYAVSSTTHLAQFLKPNSDKKSKSLIKRRSLSIIDMVIERLCDLKKFQASKHNALITNYDFKHALTHIRKNKKTVVYVDPPYFKEHYSRYYHVLDTFLLYDYPLLTINKQTKDVTIGRYREDRLVSDFGKRSTVKEAFHTLMKNCFEKSFSLAISYADTSLVSKKEIIMMAKKVGYKCKVDKKKLMHSGQGQPVNKEVSEFLFILSH